MVVSQLPCLKRIQLEQLWYALKIVLHFSGQRNKINNIWNKQSQIWNCTSVPLVFPHSSLSVSKRTCLFHWLDYMVTEENSSLKGRNTNLLRNSSKNELSQGFLYEFKIIFILIMRLIIRSKVLSYNPIYKRRFGKGTYNYILT